VLDEIAVPGVLVDHRIIAPGDELGLLRGELEAFASSVIKVRRASGAARIVARGLLARIGRPPSAIPKSTSGPPVWPDGIVGSLAHDSEVAVATIAERRDFLSLGIDVEPSEPLEPEILDLVVTPTERQRMQDVRAEGRLLFAVKEAVYKAVFPIDGKFLDFHDVEVRVPRGQAIVQNERVVRFRHGIAGHIVVLAFIAT
jgi:4'-phosphopantetheinyl transferase EntD